ncbi:hypothetical protein OG943_16580 [Amycolatopsis sp. NBC_00345]|uniref:hypothetical protein n=1 Tax=Amycolatopsis sp. NBC_00345 TaxID=2975955 RepID=UPI002E25CD0B
MSTQSLTPPSALAAGPTERPADPGFEQRLIDGIRPISEHFLAGALHHLFTTGLFDRLAEQEDGLAVQTLADDLSMDLVRLTGFLRYLANEGVTRFDGETVRLTPKGLGYGEFRGWYTMMIGGYTGTLSQMGAALTRGAPSCSREGGYVGLGSCEVSRYDGMPMTRQLMADAGVEARELLDLGCGNGLYLVDFCRAMPGLSAWGVEPSRGGYEEAIKLVGSSDTVDRIRLINSSATDFLADPPEGCAPDLIVLGFVLHEILAQEGEGAVLDLLRGVVKTFPEINIVVIEVAHEIENPAVMRHGLATNFWNPYYLIHSFTEQQLEKKVYWDELFDRAGLGVAAFVTTDPAVDSTGLELGYLLRGKEAGGGGATPC